MASRIDPSGQLSLFSDDTLLTTDPVPQMTLEKKVQYVLELLERPPLPQGAASLPSRFGYIPSDFYTEHINKKNLEHLLVGFINLQHQLQEDLTVLAAALNPDELLTYAWGIGMRAERARVDINPSTLYNYMKMINQQAYDPQNGISGNILQVLQNRVRSNLSQTAPSDRQYFQIRGYNLRDRMDKLQQSSKPEIRAVLEKAQAAFVDARRVGVKSKDYEDGKIEFWKNPPALKPSEIRKAINRVVDCAWRNYQQAQS